jgi:hypothetical protein
MGVAYVKYGRFLVVKEKSRGIRRVYNACESKFI